MVTVRLSRSSTDPFVRIPFTTVEGGSAPSFCVTLCEAGDMGLDRDDSLSRRRKILENLEIEEEKCAALHQVHSRAVIRADNPKTVYRRDGDGLYTLDPEVVLSVTVADCIPLALFQENPFCSALLHSGWKGTGIVRELTDTLRTKLNIAPENTHAVIGPGIGPCCYAVDRKRAEVYQSTWGSETVQFRGGRYFIDLKKANINLLREAGIYNVTVVENCTCCDHLFGSYRRQGAEDFTRMVALLGYFK